MLPCKMFLHILCFAFILTLSACDSDPKPETTILPETTTSPPTQQEQDKEQPIEENNKSIDPTAPTTNDPSSNALDDSMQDLQLHYYATTHQYYRDIVIEFGEIRYTFFNDTNNRCRRSQQKAPCWSKKDLKRIATALQQDEIDNLLAIINETQLLALAEDKYGTPDPAKPNAREDISVRVNEQQRQFSYFTTNKKPTKPLAFAALETALLQYGRNLEGTYIAEALESNDLPPTPITQTHENPTQSGAK